MCFIMENFFREFEATKANYLRSFIAKSLTVAANYFHSIKIAHVDSRVGQPVYHRLTWIFFMAKSIAATRKENSRKLWFAAKSYVEHVAVCTLDSHQTAFSFMYARATFDLRNKTTDNDGERPEYTCNTKNK